MMFCGLEGVFFSSLTSREDTSDSTIASLKNLFKNLTAKAMKYLQ